MTTTLRALMIEDSLDDAELAAAQLRLAGFAVGHERVDTEAAMRAALAEAAWDVILCDFSMPRFEAMRALAVARELCPETPFVIISGTIGEDAAVAAMRAGAHDYFIKGNLARLGSAVERMVAEAEVARQGQRTRDALRDAEERFRLLMDGVEDVAILMVDPVGTIVSWYVGAERLFGYEAAEAVGRDFAMIFTPEDRELGVPHTELGKAAATGKSEDTRWHQRKDGSRFFADGVTTLVRDARGDPRGFAKIARDKTRQRAAEAEREQLLRSEQTARAEAERLYEAAQVMNRMKDEFLATVSHELRTPLNAIVGHADLLMEDASDPAELRDSIEVIHRNAHAQAQLIADLLDVSGIISGKFTLDTQDVELRALLEESVASVRLAAQAKEIALTLDLGARPETVAGDTIRLRQVVWNLLSNAVKFTPQGGTVRVAMRRVQAQIEVEIADSGRGIEPEFLPFVFDRFRQQDSSTTRRFGGLGLGLAIVRYLVELHGGRVHVESAGAGMGASFFVRLPLRSRAIDPNAAGVGGATPPDLETARDRPLVGLRILVVDDEADARHLVERVLLRAGAEVTLARTAAEALARLRQGGLDLLLSDIGMPDEDGHSLVRKLREAEQTGGAARLVSIALTAYAGEVEHSKVLTSGFDSYLSKPVRSQVLVEAVQKLLGRATRP